MVSNLEKTILYYNAISKGYKELYWKEQKNKLELINKFSKLDKIEGKTILDGGAGDGILNNYLNIEKNNIISLDISYKMLVKNTNNKKIVGDLSNLPFKNEVFDIIFCLTVIQDITNYNSAINELKRVLKNKGLLIISILKKSPRLKLIKKQIANNFKIKKEIEENKDIILFTEKT